MFILLKYLYRVINHNVSLISDWYRASDCRIVSSRPARFIYVRMERLHRSLFNLNLNLNEYRVQRRCMRVPKRIPA